MSSDAIAYLRHKIRSRDDLCGVFILTHAAQFTLHVIRLNRGGVASAEASYQSSEFHQVHNAEQCAPLAHDDLRVRGDEVCPLRCNGANGLIIDPQEEPHAVPVVSLTHAGELLSAEWMERVRYTY